jgi:hypothetical protein
MSIKLEGPYSKEIIIKRYGHIFLEFALYRNGSFIYRGPCGIVVTISFCSKTIFNTPAITFMETVENLIALAGESWSFAIDNGKTTLCQERTL